MPSNGTDGLQFFDLSHPWGHDAPLWPYFPDVKIERFHYHAKSGVLSQQITTFMHGEPVRHRDRPRDGRQRPDRHVVDPKEIFGAEAFDAAIERGDVSTIVAAQNGMGEEPPRDERGRPNNGRMAHICRDTPDGMVLRSRFWLGGGSGPPPEALRGAISERVGLGLMRQANTEFKYLSRFLPSLYVADRREAEPVELPW